MGEILFVALMISAIAGLAMAVGALFQIKRHGGFEQAMALTSEGKWPPARLLFAGGMICFGITTVIAFID